MAHHTFQSDVQHDTIYESVLRICNEIKPEIEAQLEIAYHPAARAASQLAAT